jgi:hypothetical protein
MGPQVPDEPFGSLFNDPDLGAVFARSSPADTLAAVLTEARLVLAEVENPLDAELWGSDIVAALSSGGDQADDLASEQAGDLAGDQVGHLAGDPAGDPAADLADAIVSAAEGAATPEALATLIVLGAVGSGPLGEAARAAAGRLAEAGISRPDWAESIGAPSPGQCWCYGDVRGHQEAVTMTFWYADQGHVVSVLLDHDEGGAIKDIWVGEAGDILDRTRKMARLDSKMIFEMITQADARARLDRAFAAGECPGQQAEASNVASRRAILRTRMALLHR